MVMFDLVQPKSQRAYLQSHVCLNVDFGFAHTQWISGHTHTKHVLCSFLYTSITSVKCTIMHGCILKSNMPITSCATTVLMWHTSKTETFLLKGNKDWLIWHKLQFLCISDTLYKTWILRSFLIFLYIHSEKTDYHSPKQTHTQHKLRTFERFIDPFTADAIKKLHATEADGSIML